ncbi:MAG: hypothetical protein WAQ25_03405 [Candidatus Saccharimonas sp.]
MALLEPEQLQDWLARAKARILRVMKTGAIAAQLTALIAPAKADSSE